MTDHPLLFRGEMVQALLDGRKTQTRRPAWRVGRLDAEKASPTWFPTAASRIKVGDLVWVRETWRDVGGFAVYRADCDDLLTWTPSIHLPRRYSRLTLPVVDVRKERVQAISEADAAAEGCIKLSATGRAVKHRGAQYAGLTWPTCRDWYREIYERIHGPDAWAANPEVVVLTFTVHKANIDAFKKQAAA